jgi:hypothetical protein
MRAKLLLGSTACTIQTKTNVPSAAPRLGMLRNLHRLLAPPSAHTIYYHRTPRARVINYCHLPPGTRAAAVVLTVSLPTTPGEKTRKIGPLQPEHAIWLPLVFTQSQTVF